MKPVEPAKSVPAPLLLANDALFVAAFCLCYGVAAYVAVTVTVALGGAFFAPVGLLAGVVALVGVVSLLQALVPRPADGVHPLGSSGFVRWGLRFVLQRQLSLFPVKQLVHYVGLLRLVTYRAMGSQVAWSTSISSDVTVLDWDRLVAGRGVVVGTEARLYTHYIDGDGLVLGTIRLGEGALVSALAVVGPGTEIGAGARVDIEARVESRVRVGAGARIGGKAIVRSGAVIEPGARVAPRGFVDKGEVVSAGK